MTRDVVVTGIGMVSSLGEGPEAHVAAWRAGGPPVIDASTFAPYSVHPMVPLELDRQIPKKSDQRQMEPWQRLGVYAAGLAIEAAGLKDDAEAKSRLECIVAAGGGERDHAVDGQVLTALRQASASGANEKGALLNARLMGDLRPTLFLAQLSNLLAGNIAIVHGVTGASRTFMGEEQSGVDAVRTAQARIAHGQCDTMLVGGAYNAERRDMLLLFELGGALWKHPFVPVAERGQPGGFIPGSAAAFLVLEARERAEARGARMHARLAAVAADQVRRTSPGAVGDSLSRVLGRVGTGAPDTVIATTTGFATVREELAAIGEAAPGVRVSALGDLIGHAIEAAFPFGVALGAAAIASGAGSDVLVAGAGHARGEGAARLTAV